MTCIVTGDLIDITGADMAGAVVTVRTVEGIHASGSRAVLPRVETFTADGSGIVTMSLEPGRYRIAWQSGPRLYESPLSVPDEASADLADLLVDTPAPVRGSAGREVELRNDGGDIEWRYVGDPWSLLVPAGDYTATVAVGTVTTGAPGSNAAVTNAGGGKDAVFDFTIPRGDVGPQGPMHPVVVVNDAGEIPSPPDADTFYIVRA